MAAKIGICCHSATSYAHPPAHCIISFLGVSTLLREHADTNTKRRRNHSKSNIEVDKAEENIMTVMKTHRQSSNAKSICGNALPYKLAYT